MSSGISGPGLVTAQTSLQQAKEAQMLQSIRMGNAPSDDDKIKKGAQQFEAMLLSSWMQQAEKSFATVPGGDESDSDNEDGGGGDQMMSLGVQNLADSMAARGGIGLGAMISRAMHHTAEEARQAGTTQNSEKF